LLKVLEQHAGQIAGRLPAMGGVVRDVSHALSSQLDKGDVQIQSVARALAVSTRSLQRRLAAAGFTYQAVLDLSGSADLRRREAAKRHLSCCDALDRRGGLSAWLLRRRRVSSRFLSDGMASGPRNFAPAFGDNRSVGEQPTTLTDA
jgi:hypothetical protein